MNSDEYFKDFDTWNELAKALDKVTFDEYFHEREIWWCALGINIGSEQDGKSETFERPALVIKKINSGRALIAPLTTQIKDEENRVTCDSTGEPSQILLLQMRVISTKRLLRRICRIKTYTFHQVIVRLTLMLLELLEIETPQ